MTYMVGGKQYVAMSGYGTLIAYSLGEEGANFAATASRPSGIVSHEAVQQVELADAPGRDVTMRVCTSCHGAEMWSRFRLSRTGWNQTLQLMTTRGMALTEDERKTVLDYLSTYLSPINVNTAAAADLVRGLGITENQANAIVAYREKNGAFKDIDDLKRVEGFDAAAIEAKKDLITF